VRIVARSLCLLAVGIVSTMGLVTLPRATANDFMIVPGERIGDVSFSMSIDDILKQLGPPSNVVRSGSGAQAQALYSWRTHFLRVNQSLENGRVVSIRTYWIFRTTNPYKTEKGAAIGASAQMIMQAYGEGCFSQDYSTSRELYWPKQGIFFIIAQSGDAPAEILNRVNEIGVRRAVTGEVRGWKLCS